jgi:hypothetical protein
LILRVQLETQDLWRFRRCHHHPFRSRPHPFRPTPRLLCRHDGRWELTSPPQWEHLANSTKTSDKPSPLLPYSARLNCQQRQRWIQLVAQQPSNGGSSCNCQGNPSSAS